MPVELNSLGFPDQEISTMKYSQLTEGERNQIYGLSKAGFTQNAMSASVGKVLIHPIFCTVFTPLLAFFNKLDRLKSFDRRGLSA